MQADQESWPAHELVVSRAFFSGVSIAMPHGRRGWGRPMGRVCKRILPSAEWLKVLTLFTPGCKINTQIQAFLQERRCCVVYLRYGVTALAREALAIVLFTSGSKTNTHIQALMKEWRCCDVVYL